MQVISRLISSTQGGGIQQKLNAIKVENSILVSNSKRLVDSIERERDRVQTIKKISKKYYAKPNWMESIKKGLIE